MTTLEGEKLKLRGCDTVFTQVLLETGKMLGPEEGVYIDSLVAQFRDSKNNVLRIDQIVDEDADNNTGDVPCFFDAIPLQAYDYLVRTLNNSNNTTVYLSRFGDCDINTIEFTIVHDEPYEDAGILFYLSAGKGFMFNEVKNSDCDPEPIESLMGFAHPGADIPRREELKLNGCDQIFTLYDWRKTKERFDEDDDPAFCIKHIRIYRDGKNNMLEIKQPRYKHEEVDDMPAVLNALPERVSRYLADLFNTNHNITVELNQCINGGSSDVVVIYEPYEVARKMKVRIKICSLVDPVYWQIKDGVSEPIKALVGFGPYTALNS